MDLDADDGSQSDMLYVENGTSDKQTLAIKNISTLDKEMEPGDAVRFATVKNPGFGFGSGTLVAALSSGIYNNLYKTEYRSLSSDALNTAAYNNDRNGGSTYSVSQEVGPLNFAKPGTENVEALYNGDSAVNIYVVKSREHNEGAKTPSRLADLSWRYLTDWIPLPIEAVTRSTSRRTLTKGLGFVSVTAILALMGRVNLTATPMNLAIQQSYGTRSLISIV